MSKYSGRGELVQFVISFPIEAAHLIDKLQTKVKELEARCDHSELFAEIKELTRHNKALQRRDMHREKIWKKRVKQLQAKLGEGGDE